MSTVYVKCIEYKVLGEDAIKYGMLVYDDYAALVKLEFDSIKELLTAYPSKQDIVDWFFEHDLFNCEEYKLEEEMTEQDYTNGIFAVLVEGWPG